MCQLVGVLGNVKASCFPLHVVLSVAVTNLFVVVLSEIASVGLNNSFQLAAVLYGAWLNT